MSLKLTPLIIIMKRVALKLMTSQNAFALVTKTKSRLCAQISVKIPADLFTL